MKPAPGDGDDPNIETRRLACTGVRVRAGTSMQRAYARVRRSVGRTGRSRMTDEREALCPREATRALQAVFARVRKTGPHQTAGFESGQVHS